MTPNSFPIIEIYGPVLQGEGPQIGQQTMFLRTGGCDYRCGPCDSMHAVDPKQVKKNATMMTASQIVQEIWRVMHKANGNSRCEWVTISGGNPLLHDLAPVINLIHSQGLKIAVECQGTRFKPWINECDVVCVSPKGPGMEPDKELDLPELDKFVLCEGNPFLKIVIFRTEDLDFAAKMHKRYPRTPLFLSLGNPFPLIDSDQIDVMRSNLLSRFAKIEEEIIGRSDLGTAIFLPQLHVLVHGNAKEK